MKTGTYKVPVFLFGCHAKLDSPLESLVRREVHIFLILF